MKELETSVLIVGGGAGLTASRLLSTLGVDAPDQFVAWRSLDAKAAPESELEHALREVLAR